MRSGGPMAAVMMLTACGTRPTEGTPVGPRLRVAHQDARGGVTRLPNGAWVEPGDVVQVGYEDGGFGTYGVIVSVDGWGVVTTHLPSSGGAAVDLRPSAWLDHSLELDSAPHYERFFLVTDDEPFGVQAVRDEVAEGVGGSDGHRWSTFELRKRTSTAAAPAPR